jgi:hypothetical protein
LAHALGNGSKAHWAEMLSGKNAPQTRHLCLTVAERAVQ